jgi:predicted DNA-binding transcriptional regulator AlpA
MDLEWDLPIRASRLKKDHLELVDATLLAVAGRLWELARALTPGGQRMKETTPSLEQLRSSGLGRSLILIASYVEDEWVQDTGVEEAIEQVYRVLFGNTFGEGYTVPEHFHRSDLGQLFHRAYVKLYGRENLLTPAQVYHDLGIARQTLYDRVKKGKLRLISFSGETRFLRSEVEAWKAQRARRKQAADHAE